MKNLFLVAFLSLFTLTLFSQENTSVFQLKDGSTIEGKIIEKKGNGDYTVEMNDGNELTIKAKNIKRVLVDTHNMDKDNEPNFINNSDSSNGVDFSEYGSPQSFAFSLFGPGFLGFHYRKDMGNDLHLDIGGHYTSTVLAMSDEIEDFEDFDFKNGLALSAGVDYFFDRFHKQKKRKEKIRANGLFATASHNFSELNSSTLAFGWTSEYYRVGRPHRAFILHLGLQANINHWVDEPEYIIYEKPGDVNVGLYLGLKWVFHKRK